MKLELGLGNVKFAIVCFILSLNLVIIWASSEILYGRRVPGGLASYNDQLKIDGRAEEHWKHNSGDRVMLKCITGMKDNTLFFWTKDGKPLGQDYVKYQLISNGNSFLEIPSASLRNEGNYTCTVSSDFGVARKDYKLCIIARGVKEDCPRWWYNNWSQN